MYMQRKYGDSEISTELKEIYSPIVYAKQNERVCKECSRYAVKSMYICWQEIAIPVFTGTEH